MPFDTCTSASRSIKSISNLEVFSNNLSNNSARIDSILIGVETLVGVKDGQDGELQQAAKALRRALADVSRAVNNFDRNPSRVLFGASSGDAPAAPARPSNARAKAQR